MKALFKTQDPAHPYAFEFHGTEITNPIISEDGRFLVSPEYYGFEVISTGGGCTAHAQEFLLDGKKILMLITDGDAHHINKNTITATIGIYDEATEDSVADTWEVNR